MQQHLINESHMIYFFIIYSHMISSTSSVAHCSVVQLVECPLLMQNEYWKLQKLDSYDFSQLTITRKELWEGLQLLKLPPYL